MSTTPAVPVVDVLFHLRPDDGWPPAATELLTGVLEAPDRVRITATPKFVDDVSAGDTVEIGRAHV